MWGAGGGGGGTPRTGAIFFPEKKKKKYKFDTPLSSQFKRYLRDNYKHHSNKSSIFAQEIILLFDEFEG